MNHEKEAVEAAEKYADSCSPNDKRPTIGSTYSLEISLRSLWEAERNSFLAGVKWERERLKKRLQVLRYLLVEGCGGLIEDDLKEAKSIVHELLGEK